MTAKRDRPVVEERAWNRRYLESESGVFAVRAAGVFVCILLRAGRVSWTVSPPQAAASPLSLLFLELIGHCMNAARLHVNAADVLVRRGVDRDGSR
jgi:hypothetical protein